MGTRGKIHVEIDGEHYWIFGPPEPHCEFVYPAEFGRYQGKRCGHLLSSHLKANYRHEFQGPEPDPGPWDIVPALVHTEWTCPHCGEDNDVWGEGAINSWMECSNCRIQMYLSLDAYLSDSWQPWVG